MTPEMLLKQQPLVEEDDAIVSHNLVEAQHEAPIIQEAKIEGASKADLEPKIEEDGMHDEMDKKIDAALKIEMGYFVELIMSKQSRAMIRSFFMSLQELNKLKRRPKDVEKQHSFKISDDFIVNCNYGSRAQKVKAINSSKSNGSEAIANEIAIV